MSTRILFGSMKGKEVPSIPPSVVSSSKALRPTMSMVRSVLFNLLLHNPSLAGRAFEHASILDLCCGGGIVGFEFISMGAKNVTFVDQNPAVISMLKQNASNLGISNKIKTEIKKLPSIITGRFDIVFFDPPYMDMKLLVSQMEGLLRNENLNKNAIVAVESDKTTVIPEMNGFKLLLTRGVNSKAKLSFFEPKN